MIYVTPGISALLAKNSDEDMKFCLGGGGLDRRRAPHSTEVFEPAFSLGNATGDSTKRLHKLCLQYGAGMTKFARTNAHGNKLKSTARQLDVAFRTIEEYKGRTLAKKCWQKEGSANSAVYPGSRSQVPPSHGQSARSRIPSIAARLTEREQNPVFKPSREEGRFETRRGGGEEIMRAPSALRIPSFADSSTAVDSEDKRKALFWDESGDLQNGLRVQDAKIFVEISLRWAEEKPEEKPVDFEIASSSSKNLNATDPQSQSCSFLFLQRQLRRGIRRKRELDAQRALALGARNYPDMEDEQENDPPPTALLVVFDQNSSPVPSLSMPTQFWERKETLSVASISYGQSLKVLKVLNPMSTVRPTQVTREPNDFTQVRIGVEKTLRTERAVASSQWSVELQFSADADATSQWSQWSSSFDSGPAFSPFLSFPSQSAPFLPGLPKDLFSRMTKLGRILSLLDSSSIPHKTERNDAFECYEKTATRKDLSGMAEMSFLDLATAEERDEGEIEEPESPSATRRGEERRVRKEGREDVRSLKRVLSPRAIAIWRLFGDGDGCELLGVDIDLDESTKKRERVHARIGRKT
ncbi:hypothetical protein SCHPADRAFT_896339 [Schizopora paradoxa]|uniref:Uncharacterized protein n=1 Tax=Schizopora paradoxa TaxID=27342 RepID=A0A0H2RKJ9_9AGAM|nr:hypothetical protein SCHPADRAFT_896339 [Schizopora paradoxa]